LKNLRLTVTDFLAPAKVLVCSKCVQIGPFRSTCKNITDLCKTCSVAVQNINEHKDVCAKTPCCVRCGGAHQSSDKRCPEVKSFRAALEKFLLTSTNHPNHHQFNPETHRNADPDFPTLNIDRHHNYRSNQPSNYTSQRIDELFNKLNKLDDNLNRMINLNNNFSNLLARTQLLVTKHDNALQVHQIDLVFQREFVSQFISPVCQVLLDIIPTLVKKKVISDKTLLCPSLTELSEKLSGELPVWTNRFLQNENIKTKMINDFNTNNPELSNTSSNNEAPPPPQMLRNDQLNKLIQTLPACSNICPCDSGKEEQF